MEDEEDDFTLTEFLTDIGKLLLGSAVFFAFMGFAGTAIAGNCWVTEDGVLEHIRLTNPETEDIIGIDRNLTHASIVTTDNSDGSVGIYEVDTGMFSGYTALKVR